MTITPKKNVDTTNIEVLVDTDTSISFSNQDSLLQALEAHNIEVHFHCREGYCGACRTKLKKGQVEYTIDPLAFIDDDEILPCCCIPTQNLEIELA